MSEIFFGVPENAPKVSLSLQLFHTVIFAGGMTNFKNPGDFSFWGQVFREFAAHTTNNNT